MQKEAFAHVRFLDSLNKKNRKFVAMVGSNGRRRRRRRLTPDVDPTVVNTHVRVCAQLSTTGR